MTVKTKLCSILLFGYILGIRNGLLALWSGDGTEPVVFPYRVEMLPPADQRRLEEGISISDCSELSRLLEDYLS